MSMFFACNKIIFSWNEDHSIVRLNSECKNIDNWPSLSIWLGNEPIPPPKKNHASLKVLYIYFIIFCGPFPKPILTLHAGYFFMLLLSSAEFFFQPII